MPDLRAAKLDSGREGPACLFAVWSDKCEAALRILLFLQRNRIDSNKNLKCGRHNGLDHVPPASPAVTMSDGHVRVERRLALIQSEVSNHRQHFHLFVDRDLSIHFLLQIKPRKR